MKQILLFILLVICVLGSSQNNNLVFPKDGQFIQDTSLVLKWDKSPLDTNYYLTLASDSLFQNKIIDAQLIIENFQLISLYSNTTYYWYINYYPTNQLTDTFQFSIFNPDNIDSLTVWLSSENQITTHTNNNIKSIRNKADTSFIRQNNNSNAPVLLDSIYLSFSSINFSNNSDFLYGNYISPQNNYYNHITTIARTSGASQEILFSMYMPNLWTFYSLMVEYRYYHLRVYKGDGNNNDKHTFNSQMSEINISHIDINMNDSIKLRVNNSQSNYNYIPYRMDSIPEYIIGGRTNNGSSISREFSGDLFELIQYSKSLNSNEEDKLNKYLIDKYTPPINLGPNILRRYSFCDTTLRTTKMYESYLWSTGDTTREITIAKEDTGWYWCEVPNLFGDIMRDSVYVYNLLPQQDFQDQTVCYGDTLNLSSNYSIGYSNQWKTTHNDSTISTSPFLHFPTSQDRQLALSITDSLGCQITDTLTIKIDSFPLTASLGPNKSVCTGDKIGLQTQASKATQWQWNTGSQDSLIVIDTAGTYTLQATDTNSCIAKDTINISIKGITPIVGYIADTVCRTDSTIFIDTSYTLDASSITQWIWQYSATSSPTHQLTNSPTRYLYSDSGTYTTKLTVTTDSGCTNYAYKQVYVRPLPQPNFSPLTACQNLNVQLNNQTISPGGNIANNLWIVNNTDSFPLSPLPPFPTSPLPPFPTSPLLRFASSGNQNIKLITTDIHGCTDSITKQLYVKPSPNANFQYTTACEGERIYFADSSQLPLSNQILEQKWWFNNFQDSSLAVNPSFQFDSAGYWPVKYYVKGLNGCWDTIYKNIALHPFIKADFAYQDLCYQEDATFFGSATHYSDVPSTTEEFRWYVDNQFYGNAQNLNYTFNDTLEHQLGFYIRSTAGCEDSIQKTVKVHPLPNAAFTTNRQYGLPPLEIEFTNQSSYAANYYWDFGDGQNSTVENPVHTYQDSTIYTAILQAENIFGCTDTAQTEIHAVYAMIDLAITDIKADINDNYIEFSIHIINQGLRPVNKIEFEAGINNAFSIKEVWEGSLAPGKAMTYNFIGLTKVENIEELRYYCAKATVITIDEQLDERPDNNEICIEANETQWIGSPYPNPAIESLSLDYILSINKKLQLSVYNNHGDQLMSNTYQGKRGLNRIILPITDLSPGIYYLRINIEDEIIQRRFVVQ